MTSPEVTYSTIPRLRLVAIPLTLLASITFAIAFFLPVYTDELGWKLMMARTHLDAGSTLNLTAACGKLGTAVPWPLMPLRWLDRVFYGQMPGPGYLRVTGIATGLVGVSAVIALLMRLGPRFRLETATLVVLAFSTIGIMPFLIEMNRPEQVLAIAIVVLALPLVLDWTPAPRSLPADLLCAAALFAFCSFVLAAHPRGLFVLPIILLFAFRALTRTPLAVLTSACLLALSGVVFRDWSARTVCADPALTEVFATDNITFAAGRGLLGWYLRLLVGSWHWYPLRLLYVQQSQFHSAYTSDMIPPVAGSIAGLVGRVSALAFLGQVGAGAVAFLLCALRPRQWRLHLVPLLALGSLWAFWAGSAISRIYKNDYEAAVMVPVLVIASVGSIAVAGDVLRGWMGVPAWRRVCQGALLGLVGLSVANQTVFIGTFLPWARGAWITPGYAEGQAQSTVAFGYGSEIEAMKKAGAMCGIDAADPPKHLVLDELTYYVYQRSFEPILASYIDPRSWGRGIRDHRALLRQLGSQGAVIGCQWVPADLRADAKRDGQFCCLTSFAG